MSLHKIRFLALVMAKQYTCHILNNAVGKIYCKVKVKSLSRVRLFATPWTVAYTTSPSMGFSRQEY